MAKKAMVERNLKREKTVDKYAAKRAELKARAKKGDREAILELSKLPRNASPTRVRNRCQINGRPRGVPFSRIKESIANILKNEGYINGYEIKEEGAIKNIVVSLKTVDGEAVIKGLKRISKPGRRVYTSVESLPKVLGGLGIAIVSTPQGVITDKECRKHNVGGEVLCYVW